MAQIPRPEEGRSLLAPRPDHTAYGASWLLKLLAGHRGLFAPAADPTQSAHGHRKSLTPHSDIRHGYVVDYVAYARCYRVFLDGNHPIIPCALLMQGSSTPWGARSLSSIPPGCGVQVLVHPQRTYGFIIGVEPRQRIDARESRADWISQSGRCGLRVDGVHRQVFQCTGKGGVIDWSTNRPMDSLSGEEGWITETGVRIFIDPFMAQLAANEACGVTVFYHDDLLRLAGYNLHQFTCGSTLEVLDDEGEVHWVGGWSPFPWEQLGCLRPGVDPFRDVTAQAAQFDEPHYSYVEPKEDRQIPFQRTLDLRGYLGQGGKRMILTPPEGELYLPGPPADPARPPPAPDERPEGVLDEFRSLTGRYAVRSAKGIHLAKRVGIPAPRPRRRPEDPAGDNPENYRPSGHAGAGPAHRLAGGPAADGTLPHLRQAAGLIDLHAWVFNWEAYHPLHYHGNDWELPEEAETRLAPPRPASRFADLAHRFFLPRPEALRLKVDHRYGTVDYFPNEANVDMNDDGSVVLADGYGAEIRLVGGHIYFHCPGDIWFLPGRNINGWAGRDLCLRARNSCDITATDRDVRLKAEKNLHLLGGNDGRVGGVLIESNAPSSYAYDDAVGEDVVSGGVQLRASAGALVTWSKDVYIRTGGGDIASGGQIVIDADRGRGVITTNSRFLINYAAESMADYFGTAGEIRAANIYSAQGNVLGAALEVVGSGIFTGTVLVNGWFEAVGGHIATELAQNPKYAYVAPLKDRPLAEARDVLERAVEVEKKSIDEARRGYRQGFTEYWYKEPNAGSDKTIRAAHVTLRTDGQYGTAGFDLYEARWQQLARLAHEPRTAWVERPVRVGNRATYPYPGADAWAKDAHLHEQDPTLYDGAAGQTRPRGGAEAGPYEQPRLGVDKTRVLDGNYTIIA
jgi:hypothetical protein